MRTHPSPINPTTSESPDRLVFASSLLNVARTCPAFTASPSRTKISPIRPDALKASGVIISDSSGAITVEYHSTLQEVTVYVSKCFFDVGTSEAHDTRKNMRKKKERYFIGKNLEKKMNDFSNE